MSPHRLAQALLGLTFVLLLVGGTVNPTGSSLACPDWPTCYGTFFPKMEGGVLFEHTHRVVATVVGFVTMLLAAQTWRRAGADGKARALTLLALAAVIVQGVLGGITVLYRLPTAVSTAHLALALAFFSFVIYLCFRLRPDGWRLAPVSDERRRAGWIVAALAGAVYAQILLGALVRHTGAGKVCPDLPLCNGEMWPAWGPGQLHMLHRWMGVLLAAAVIAGSIPAIQVARRTGQRTARTCLAMTHSVVLAQVLIGAWMVAKAIAWVPAMIHLGVGALLLGVLVGAALDLLGAPLGAQRSSLLPGAGVDPDATRQAPGFARDLLTLCKPSITAMNVLAALGGYSLAGGVSPGKALWAAFGTGVAVAAANVLNMWMEREGDRSMARTAARPLPSGRVSPRLALVFGLGLSILSIALLATINTVTASLGLLAIFAYVCLYTPMKRRSPLALVVGAVPGAAPPLMGWTAATGELGLGGLVLFGILWAWQMPHFIAIALYRGEDYARAGIQTVVAVRGDRVAKAQAVAWATLLLAVSLALVPLGHASWGYGVVAAALGLWYLGWSLRGFRADAGIPWARRFFFASLVYLPALCVALALDVALR